MRIHLRFFAFLLPLLTLDVSAQVEDLDAKAARLESVRLDLEPDAAFVDAAFFAQAWTKLFPEERCVVLRLDGAQDERKPVAAAAAVYTKKGQVFARGISAGCVLLTGVAAADLDSPSKLEPVVGTALQQASVSAPAPAEAQNIREQLLIASARIRSAPGCEDLPFVLGQIKAQVKKGNETVSEDRDFILFYFEGKHCAYRPGVGGTFTTPLPKNKTYGYLLPCVRGGDVIDAIFYLQALKARNKNAQARLGGIGDGTQRAPLGLACTLYTKGEELWAHNLYLGDFNIGMLRASDFGNEAQVCIALVKIYQRVYQKIRTLDMPEKPSLQYDDIMTFFSASRALALPGDTPRLQTLRAAQMLRAAGLKVRDLKGGDTVRFAYEENSFYYGPDKGSTLLRTQKPGPRANTDSKGSSPAPKQQGAGIATRYVPSSDELAKLKAKADQGDVGACKEFGQYLMDGNGLARDTAKAVEYLAKAADAGDGECGVTLARYFDKTEATPEDLALARKYFLVAAKDSFPVAMYNYGAMLYSGRGGPRNLSEGLAWMIVAGRFGFRGPGEENARRDLARFEKPILEAEERAREIYNSFPVNASQRTFVPTQDAPVDSRLPLQR